MFNVAAMATTKNVCVGNIIILIIIILRFLYHIISDEKIKIEKKELQILCARACRENDENTQ